MNTACRSARLAPLAEGHAPRRTRLMRWRRTACRCKKKCPRLWCMAPIVFASIAQSARPVLYGHQLVRLRGPLAGEPPEWRREVRPRQEIATPSGGRQRRRRELWRNVDDNLRGAAGARGGHSRVCVAGSGERAGRLMRRRACASAAPAACALPSAAWCCSSLRSRSSWCCS